MDLRVIGLLWLKIGLSSIELLFKTPQILTVLYIYKSD
jgi:hypothetical protein